MGTSENKIIADIVCAKVSLCIRLWLLKYYYYFSIKSLNTLFMSFILAWIMAFWLLPK